MDLMFEKIEAISEKPKSRTSNTNTEASYTNKRNAYIKKLNDGAILQPKPETMEYYKVVKEGDKYVQFFIIKIFFKNVLKKKAYIILDIIMFKMSYCWKYEEIKGRHKTLNQILPDIVCDMLENYKICKTCTRMIYLNKNFELHKLKHENKDNEYFKHEVIFERITNKKPINELSYTIQDFKIIIKRTDINKSKKQKMLDFIRHYDPNNLDENYQSNVEKIQCIANTIQYPNIFKNNIEAVARMYRDVIGNVIKELVILLWQDIISLIQFRYNLTDYEIRDYIEFLIK